MRVELGGPYVDVVEACAAIEAEVKPVIAAMLVLRDQIDVNRRIAGRTIE
jgi:hypothetical protein